jgi:ribosomal protein L14
MDNLITPKNVIFIGDYFSMIVSVAVPYEDVEDGEVYEDACLRAAKSVMKHHYGWDVEAVCNHIGVLDEGDPNCGTRYGRGKVNSEVAGAVRELECPDCFND